jgi:hypothetical protein
VAELATQYRPVQQAQRQQAPSQEWRPALPLLSTPQLEQEPEPPAQLPRPPALQPEQRAETQHWMESLLEQRVR